MKKHLELPEYFFESLREGSRSTRIEHVDSALLAVVNDVVFNFGLVSSDVATLWSAPAAGCWSVHERNRCARWTSCALR